jgi:hypothetical protein
MAAIGSCDAITAETSCATTKEISNNIRLVKVETDSRERLELAGKIADCLMDRADAGTINEVDGSIIDRLIDLLNDPDDGVRNEAAISLGWFGPRAKRAIAPLRHAYVRVEDEVLSKMDVMPTSASDEGIVAALVRITGKPASELKLPPIRHARK